jgi:2-oxoglutarate ferredoxin oxidoreductase subunit delta
MPRMHVKEDVCKGCELCVYICPKKVVKMSPGLNAMGYHPATYAGQGCVGCRSCATICPDVAIEVFREMKEDQPTTK